MFSLSLLCIAAVRSRRVFCVGVVDILYTERINE